MPATAQQLSRVDERRLSEFVDRTAEMERFCALLDSSDKHVMVVWGEPGIGKTSLRLRMVHECAQRNLRKAEVECGGLRGAGHLEFMRKISDDLGLTHFQEFSGWVDRLTKMNRGTPALTVNVVGDVAVAEGARIGGGAEVAAITGVAVQNNTIVVSAMPEAEQVIRLTGPFIKGLAASGQEGTLVVFLDSVEKLTPDVDGWLWTELLTQVRDRLVGVKVVLCGQTMPELDRDWRMSIEEAHLQPLALEHIEAYLAKRGVAETDRHAVAMALAATTGGKVAAIAAGVDMFLELQRKQTKR